MEQMKIALDAMGGDNAPAATVQGAVLAAQQEQNIKIFLLGNEDAIHSELQKLSYEGDSIEVIHCTEEIEMAEPPVAAIQKKKDSSIVRGMKMVREGSADAFVSAGSTGAVLVGGQIVVGRLKGVERPPLGALMPTAKGMSLLVDCGANVDARPSWLLQYALMGSVYMEHIMKVKNPTVGIVNIGAEEEKGNNLVKETFPLLKEDPNINFIGSTEARDIPYGGTDVLVADAFTGNVALKMYEGTAGMLMRQVKGALTATTTSKIGALLIKSSLSKTLKKFDSKQYGGAPLLGLKGLVVKAHGSSDGDAIRNSIHQCVEFHENRINDKIKERLDANNEKMRELKKAERKTQS